MFSLQLNEVLDSLERFFNGYRYYDHVDLRCIGPFEDENSQSYIEISQGAGLYMRTGLFDRFENEVVYKRSLHLIPQYKNETALELVSYYTEGARYYFYQELYDVYYLREVTNDGETRSFTCDIKITRK